MKSFEVLQHLNRARETHAARSVELVGEIRNTVLSMPDEPSAAWLNELHQLVAAAAYERHAANVAARRAAIQFKRVVNEPLEKM